MSDDDGSPITSFCPFGDVGGGTGCIRQEGHAGAHMVIEPEDDEDVEGL